MTAPARASAAPWAADGASVTTPHRAAAHPTFVRVTHWLTAIATIALVISGVELVISHPRFYWGEFGNVNTPALFTLPIPASRATVPTGYGFVLPDQNGWSRSLHFQSAWLVLFAGAVYVIAGLRSRHIARQLVPAAADRSWRALRASVAAHRRGASDTSHEPGAYNVLQRVTYLAVIFGLFPFVIWTGLAMSPAFTSVVPWSVTLLGGQQSARTLHFVAMLAIVLFTLTHVVMVARAGFVRLMRAMLTGSAEGDA